MDRHADYVRAHRIPALLNELVVKLLERRPKDVVSHLIDHLESMMLDEAQRKPSAPDAASVNTVAGSSAFEALQGTVTQQNTDDAVLTQTSGAAPLPGGSGPSSEMQMSAPRTEEETRRDTQQEARTVGDDTDIASLCRLIAVEESTLDAARSIDVQDLTGPQRAMVARAQENSQRIRELLRTVEEQDRSITMERKSVPPPPPSTVEIPDVIPDAQYLEVLHLRIAAALRAPSFAGDAFPTSLVERAIANEEIILNLISTIARQHQQMVTALDTAGMTTSRTAYRDLVGAIAQGYDAPHPAATTDGNIAHLRDELRRVVAAAQLRVGSSRTSQSSDVEEAYLQSLFRHIDTVSAHIEAASGGKPQTHPVDLREAVSHAHRRIAEEVYYLEHNPARLLEITSLA